MATVEVRDNRPLPNLMRILISPNAYLAVAGLMTVASMVDYGYSDVIAESEAKEAFLDAGMPGELTYARYLQASAEDKLWGAVADGKPGLDFLEVSTVDQLQRAKVVLNAQEDVERQRRHLISDKKEEAIRRMFAVGSSALLLLVAAIPRLPRR